MPKNPDPRKNGGQKPGPKAHHDKGRFRICNTCGGNSRDPRDNNKICPGCHGKGGTALGNI